MKKGTKIAIWSVGGLLVATGLFFGIRAIVKSFKDDEDDDTIIDDPNTPDPITTTPGPNEKPLGSQGCGFPIGNNSGGAAGCKEVAQIQLAINQKHNNNTDDYIGGWLGSVSCCEDSDCDKKLAVDGNAGPCTMRAIAKYYGYCCSCSTFLRVCECTDCSVSRSNYLDIISGADVSDTALKNAGFNVQSSFSGFNGGYLNFNLPGYPSKEPSVMGNFYPGQYDFVDDNPPKSRLTHSYGQGKGFGFNGYSNQSGRQHIGLPIGVAPIWGCTDPTSPNYNRLANTNDGSCIDRESYGKKVPIGSRGAFSNQAGNARPDLGGGFSAFQNRMMNMGCNGLTNRRGALQNKLDRFDEQGIRPAQQIQLQEKIDFINTQLQQKGCELNFAGNGFSNI